MHQTSRHHTALADSLGRRTTLTRGTNIAYTYDKLNRVTDKNLPGSELDVSYIYNLLGQPLSATTSAQTVTLTYDALGRLSSQATGTGTTGYEYDLAGRRTKLTWPDTFYVTYDYDTAGNLKAIKESGTTTLAAFDYDSLGRRTTLTRGNGVATTYGFDTASRLTQLVSNPAGTSYDLTLDLSYNDAGQIKSRTASNDAYSWTGATNILHSDTTNGLNQVTLSGGIGVGYDARGNLNASGSDSYTYSSENLLTSATVGSVTTSLTYDALARLYEIGTSGGMKLVYDGTAIIGQSNGTTLGRRYVTVPGSDEVLAEYKVSNGTKDYKLTDERGSVIASIDASGNATSVNAYDEYGLPNAAGNSMRFQYTGQFYLGEVGLYYYKARMYSPTLGRFMQTDPIGYGDGSNWYNYVGGNPVNRSDPSGTYCTGSMLDIGCGGATTARACIGSCDHGGDSADRGYHPGPPDPGLGSVFGLLGRLGLPSPGQAIANASVAPGTPARMLILTSQTVDYRYRSEFKYQIADRYGNALTGSGYRAAETLTSISSWGSANDFSGRNIMPGVTNSNGRFQNAPGGIFTDYVGIEGGRLSPTEWAGAAISRQTFQVEYNGVIYPISSTFIQNVSNFFGSTSITITVEIP